MKRIVILTGSEQRHTFLRKFLGLAEGIEVLRSFCEGWERSLEALVATEGDTPLRTRHLMNRAQSEQDFFGSFCDVVPDNSRSLFLPNGDIDQIGRASCRERV